MSEASPVVPSAELNARAASTLAKMMPEARSVAIIRKTVAVEEHGATVDVVISDEVLRLCEDLLLAEESSLS